MKHNCLISTITWLPFLTTAQCRFSLTYLLLVSTWGLCLPQPVFPLGHAPYPSSSDWLRLISTLFLINNPTIPYQLLLTGTSAYKIQTAGNHTTERIRPLKSGPSIATRCRISRCEVSVARKWQLASRRLLLPTDSTSVQCAGTYRSLVLCSRQQQKPESPLGGTSWHRISYRLCGRDVECS